MQEILAHFRQAMQDAGITPPDTIIANGEKHRFSTNGRPSDTAGVYCLYTNNIPAGYFCDWRTGQYQNWRMNGTYPEKDELEYKKQNEIRRKKKREEIHETCILVKKIYSEAPKVSDNHPYLVRKKVKAYGLRKTINDEIIIPITHDGKLYSLQYIKPNGDRIFQPDSKVGGGYFGIGTPDKILCFAEGYATGASIFEATGYPVAIAFSCGNLLSVAQHLRSKFPNTIMIICADDDSLTQGNPGLTKAKEAARLIDGILAIPEFDLNRPKNATDFNDMALLYGLESVKKVVNNALTSSAMPNTTKATTFCSEIKPLPDSLPEVAPFHPLMLPEVIRNFVLDVADRQQSPPDFVAVAAICGLTAVLGRKVLIRPKQHDDWTVTPNQWGVIIGRPSAMKSPSMKEALKPLTRLESKAYEQYITAKNIYDEKAELAGLERSEAKTRAKTRVKNDDKVGALEELAKSHLTEAPPVRERLMVNDATVEKLGELLEQNPNGLILVRDELSGWLGRLAREEFHGDRAFYLECFDGNGRYVYDRIGRGTIEIKNCTLSVIGGIQPSKIGTIVRDAMRGISDDGLIQRFQLAVWPDDKASRKWIDRAPDQIFQNNYNNVYMQLHNLNIVRGNENPPFLRFTPEAQEIFIDWMEEFQIIACAEDIHPVMESHLLKMPQTIAGLALLFELINGGREAVGEEAIIMALRWASYLKSHAERLYSVVTNGSLEGARIILKRRDKLPNPFTSRDVQRKCWVGLDGVSAVTEALECLIDHNYIKPSLTTPNETGGRPSTLYLWNNKSI